LGLAADPVGHRVKDPVGDLCRSVAQPSVEQLIGVAW
jgi:hypothetical protein